MLESNNYKLSEQSRHMPLPETIENKDFSLLREYVMEHLDVKRYKGPEIIFKIMEWVSMQWKHDGYNTPPDNISSYDILQNVKNGERYRCVEYGKVTADILSSFGYISRTVGISTSYDAYGPGGMAHVVAEAWSNELDKWIFIDPQCCIYCKYNDRYLSFYEIYKLKAEGRFGDIEFIVPDIYLEACGLDKNAYIEEYKEFLGRYFGFMYVKYMLSDRITNLRLPLEGEGQPITFQGLPTVNYTFTEDARDLYFPINHTQIVFEYKERELFYNRLMELNIRSEKEFMENMHIFAAVPDFTLHLYTNTIWYDHFEVRFDGGEWTEIEGNKIDKKLQEGISLIEARAVNKAGVAGVPVYMKIEYV